MFPAALKNDSASLATSLPWANTMPIHFSISDPRTTPPYDPMTEPVLVKGTYSGAMPAKMWCVTGDGAAPAATHNPFEVGAMEFGASAGGFWEAPAPAIAGDGLKHVRIWSIQPGSLEIAFDDREYSVQSVMPPPPPMPPMPMTIASVTAKKTGKTSKSRIQNKSSSKTAQSRASQNGSPARPAAKPVGRRSGKGKAAKPKAAAATRGKGRLVPATKKKPKVSKRKRVR